MNSSRSLRQVATDASGSLVSARWLLKPPEPLAMQTQELNTKVVPSLRTALVNTPTWRTRCRCFTAKLTEGYPQDGRL
jgi:hypothetical protein